MRKKFFIIISLLVLALIILPACKAPAEFEIVSLEVTPLEVEIGETVNINAQVKNIGGSEGVYTVVLTIDGAGVETKDVLVAQEGSETVTFSLVKDKAGTYQLAIGELGSSLVVKEKEPVIRGIELRYDNGRLDTNRNLAIHGARYGYMIRFSPPVTPFTITGIEVCGHRSGTMYKDKVLELRICDKDMEPIYSETYPHHILMTYTSWITMPVPNVVVNDTFCVQLVANSQPEESRVVIFYDPSIPNEHSEMTLDWEIAEKWPKELLSLKHPVEQEKTNWMIRVYGEYLIEEEDEPEPAQYTLSYDDDTAENCVSSDEGGYSVGFAPPSVPFTIERVQMYGILQGQGRKSGDFVLGIRDKDFKRLSAASYQVTRFSHEAPAWVDVDIPDVDVTDEFYVHVWTGTGEEEGIALGADDSVANEHSDVTYSTEQRGVHISDSWPYPPNFWFGNKNKVNWMIRVVGTVMVPQE